MPASGSAGLGRWPARHVPPSHALGTFTFVKSPRGCKCVQLTSVHAALYKLAAQIMDPLPASDYFGWSELISIGHRASAQGGVPKQGRGVGGGVARPKASHLRPRRQARADTALLTGYAGSSAADELAIGKGGTGWPGLLFLHHLPEKRQQREPVPRPPTCRAWAHLGHGRETPLGRPTCAETWPRPMRSAVMTCKGKSSN